MDVMYNIEDIFNISELNNEEVQEKLNYYLKSILTLGEVYKINIIEWQDAFICIYRLCSLKTDPCSYTFSKNCLLFYHEHFISTRQKILDGDFGEIYCSEWLKFCESLKYMKLLFNYFDKNIIKYENMLLPEFQNDLGIKLYTTEHCLNHAWECEIILTLIEKLQEILEEYFKIILNSNTNDNINKLKLIIDSFKICKKIESDSNSFIFINIYEMILNKFLFISNTFSDIELYINETSKLLNRIKIIFNEIFQYPICYLNKIYNIISEKCIENKINICFEYFQINLFNITKSNFIQNILDICLINNSLKNNLYSLFYSSTLKYLTSFKNDIIVDCKELLLFYQSRHDLIINLVQNILYQNQELVQKLNLAFQDTIKFYELKQGFYYCLATKFDELFYYHDKFSISLLNQICDIYKYMSFKENFDDIFLYRLCTRIFNSSCKQFNVAFYSNILQKLASSLLSRFNYILIEMKESAELNKYFNDKILYKEINGPDFNINFNVLRQNLWPYLCYDKNIILPTDLNQVFIDFSTFYTNKYNTRNLKYCHINSYGHINYYINNKTYHLTLNNYQYTILNLLVDKLEIDINEILFQTKIKYDIFIDQIQPLLDYKIILFHHKEYSINKAFNYEHIEITLSSFEPYNIQHETELDGTKSSQDIFIDYESIIKCHIISMLKINHELTYDEIKQRIKITMDKYCYDVDDNHLLTPLQNLIEREFILEKMPKIYQYLV